LPVLDARRSRAGRGRLRRRVRPGARLRAHPLVRYLVITFTSNDAHLKVLHPPVDLLPAKRQLNRGFGDTLSRAFEFAVSLGLFLFLGWLIDRWLGTQPVFMIVLTIFAFAGLGVRLWISYDQEMRKHEAAHRERHGVWP
jgi:Flp pilus assembly protein TadB